MLLQLDNKTTSNVLWLLSVHTGFDVRFALLALIMIDSPNHVTSDVFLPAYGDQAQWSSSISTIHITIHSLWFLVLLIFSILRCGMGITFRSHHDFVLPAVRLIGPSNSQSIPPTR